MRWVEGGVQKAKSYGFAEQKVSFCLCMSKKLIFVGSPRLGSGVLSQITHFQSSKTPEKEESLIQFDSSLEAWSISQEHLFSRSNSPTTSVKYIHTLLLGLSLVCFPHFRLWGAALRCRLLPKPFLPIPINLTPHFILLYCPFFPRFL